MSTRGYGRLCILLAGLVLALGSRAQQLPASPADSFVVSNVQFVLMHELAHLVIDEKQIPIIGPEETAADYLATMLLIRPRWARAPGDDMLLRIAVQTGDGFAIAWQRAASLGRPLAYWGAHALTVQRFSTVACLIYGSDPKRFASLPALADMPPGRAASCPSEFEKAQRGVDWLFANYARKPDEPEGAPVKIEIDPAPTRTSARLFAAWRASGLIDATFARLGQFFAIDEPFTFVARSCGEPQARWIAATRELVVCYELLDAYALMSRSQHLSQTEALFTGNGTPGRELLNSERIERAFGSYGVEVLEADRKVRVSNLYSVDASGRVCRTFAVVRYPRAPDKRLAPENAAITNGASIGATFAAAGWRVGKSHLYIGELPAGQRVATLMGIAEGTPLALDIYVLEVSKDGTEIEYAAIGELHHPDYLKPADLTVLYGAPSAGSRSDDRLVRDMLALVRERAR